MIKDTNQFTLKKIICNIYIHIIGGVHIINKPHSKKALVVLFETIHFILIINSK